MTFNCNSTKNRSGFTLVELLVAMVVGLLVSAAVYASYKVQQQTSNAQGEVRKIQQNLRAGMEMMTADFKHVGFDPFTTGSYEILNNTNKERFNFTADLCENAEVPKAVGAGICATGPYSVGQPPPLEPQDMTETFSYGLFDSDGDGVNDALMREATVPPVAIAENIQQVEFYYILDNGTASVALTPAQRRCVRSVRVTLVGRADEPDYKYTNNDTYTLGSGTVIGPFNDNFRRRSLTRTIELRNMEITWPPCP